MLARNKHLLSVVFSFVLILVSVVPAFAASNLWNFENNGNDSIGPANLTTSAGSITYSTSSPPQGTYFVRLGQDNSNSTLIENPSNVISTGDTTQLYIAGYIKTTTSGANASWVIGKNTNFELRVASNAFKMSAKASDSTTCTYTFANFTFSSDVWYYFVYQKDGQNFKLTIDSVLKDTKDCGTSFSSQLTEDTGAFGVKTAGSSQKYDFDALEFGYGVYAVATATATPTNTNTSLPPTTTPTPTNTGTSSPSNTFTPSDTPTQTFTPIPTIVVSLSPESQDFFLSNFYSLAVLLSLILLVVTSTFIVESFKKH